MKHRDGHIKSVWVDVGAYRLHTRVSVDPVPDGPLPVVLVHGLAVSSLYFVPTHRHLAPHYRVYAPDLPGFGRSVKPAHILTVRELANMLAAYLKTVGIERAVLVGNSLGCQIIVDFALRYPEYVDRAVLVGPTMDRHARFMPRQILRLALDSLREPLSQPFVVGFDYLRSGPRRAFQTAHYAIEDPIEEKAPYVRAPMIVVRGERDPIVPRRWAAELAQRLPGGRLIEVAGSAHTVNYSHPAELTRIIREFVAES